MAEAKRGRGRPKGSTTKAKESGDGLKGSGLPAAGHNSSPELTDAEQRALMIDHSRKIRLKDAEIAELREERKSLIGAAKANGIMAKDIKMFLALQDREDEEIAEEQRKLIKYAHWQGRGIQADLFADLQVPVDGHAYNDGFRAGVEGAEPKSDYTGAAHQEWLKGHHEGAAAMKSALEKTRAEEESTIIPMIDQTHAERAAAAGNA